jgi:hypothetical protein
LNVSAQLRGPADGKARTPQRVDEGPHP